LITGITNISYFFMKTFVFTCLLVGITLVTRAQHSTLNGIWTGTLTNDSSTTRKDQSFELALTQYENKVYGYVHTQFIVNDTLYYIMKRVKGTIKDSVCEVKDDEILSYNFRGKLDKGIVTSYFFRLNKADSSWQLNGKWQTNKTKKFYAISGQMTLKPAANQQQAKITAHLEELNLTKNLPFLNTNKPVVAASPRPVEKKKVSEPKTTNSPATGITKTEKTVAEMLENKMPDAAVITELSTLQKIAQRSTGLTQTVYFTGDSLQLAFYDNGEIDGDTVSVQVSGEVIFDKACLKSTALRKTIYIEPGTDETTLLLFAENLGKYPPNTGLLVVYEGEKRTQVHFSANLEQNAAVIFKRVTKK
jgi:hypothetical protein